MYSELHAFPHLILVLRRLVMAVELNGIDGSKLYKAQRRHGQFVAHGRVCVFFRGIAL